MADGALALNSTGGRPPDAFERAHAMLLRQTDLQFVFPPLPQPHTPEWLKRFLEWIGHGLVGMAPAFKFIFWGGLIAGGGLIVYFIFWELAASRWGWRKSRKVRPVQLEAEWRPNAARARTLLEDADRLAAEGRFGEAIHLLLFRSIEDIDARWPNTVRPDLTSRDIAEHPRLSDAARRTFARIAQVVEVNVFGGAEVGAEDFRACRQAYAAFALPVTA